MMKKLVYATMLSMVFVSARANDLNHNLDLKGTDKKVVKLKKSKINYFGDCVLTIKGNYGGHQVDVVVTISDVSLVKCLALKAGIAAYKN